jgi:Putative transposase/Transposase zinc-binding domain
VAERGESTSRALVAGSGTGHSAHGYSYARHRPETTTLYAVVRDNLNTLYAAVETGFSGVALPEFVRNELEGYLECGLLCRGFALLKCSECAERKLVAFCCKGRGFCPACLGRKMCQTAANLIEHVVPSKVPLRQWVLTLPHALRYRLAYDGRLLGAVCRVFVDSVLGWYSRRLVKPGATRGKGGAVTVIQRTASDLRLHPHFHAVFLDGVYIEHVSGELEFVALPRLSTTEVADVLQVVRVRILNYLERRGVIEPSGELRVLDDELSEREPALAELARAATRAGGLDAAGREALLKYVLRPAIANERVQQGPEGLVRIALKKPFTDGTVAIDLDPLSLLCRLCASVPSPKMHTVRYGGVLAAHCAWRPLIIPTAKIQNADAPPLESSDDSAPPHVCSRYRPWSELLKRTFGIDVEQCERCGARMQLIALVVHAQSIARILQHLGEATEPPVRAPARGPPYFASRAVRRKPAQQQELFE